MHSLRELQLGFIDALLADDAAAVPTWIGSRGLPAVERFAIYRNNCREGFLAVLQAGYPVVRRLGGDDWFRQVVREYQHAHPSPSGNLHHAGARFPAFLADRLAGTAFEYFGAVAGLEWACQEVMLAADHAAFDFARLATVSPADFSRLRFELDPAARLVQSRFPVVSVWEAHQDGNEPGPIDLAAGGECALAIRRGAGVAIYRLPPAEHAALAAFRAAGSLGAAITAALGLDAAFDLPAALRRWAQLGFIVDFSVVGESLGT